MKHFQKNKQLSSTNVYSSTDTCAYIERLQTLDGVFIEKCFSFQSKCISNMNMFKIYAADNQGKKICDTPFLQSQEYSSDFQYLFCQNNCREYELDFKQHQLQSTSSTLNTTINDESTEEHKDTIQDVIVTRVVKDYQYVYWCCRPKVFVYLPQDNTQNMVGYVEVPINICTKGVDVFNSKDELQYQIRADCCQIGMWCDLPCDKCQAITFQIQDANGKVIVELNKISVGCCNYICQGENCFKVPFPPNSSTETKALLIGATVLIDYTFFPTDAHHNERS